MILWDFLGEFGHFAGIFGDFSGTLEEISANLEIFRENLAFRENFCGNFREICAFWRNCRQF